MEMRFPSRFLATTASIPAFISINTYEEIQSYAYFGRTYTLHEDVQNRRILGLCPFSGI
jgi:hypothetical protein